MDKRSYKQGDVVQFNQNMRGVKRGSVWPITSSDKNKITLTNDEGKTINLPIDQHTKFDVFKRSEIGISKGDKIRITKNGFDAKDKHMDNGQILEILLVRKNGHIKARNVISKVEYSVPQDYGHIAHAHCITSHASQGKTVDEVFIAQPSSTFPATDLKQFYVSVSRGRDRVSIYTDDKEALLHHASNMRDRESAMELLGKSKVQSNSVADHIIRQEMQKQPAPNIRTKSIEKSELEKSHYHEPEPEI